MAPASSERSPSLEPRADLGQTSHEGGWHDNKCDRRCCFDSRVDVHASQRQLPHKGRWASSLCSWAYSSSMPKQPAHLVALEKTQAARALRSNTSQGARDSCCNLLPVSIGTACMRYQC